MKRNSVAWDWRAFSTGSNITLVLTRVSNSCSFWDFYKFSRLHIVDVAVYRNVLGNQWVVSDTHDILDDALRIVRKCKPIDVVAFCRPRPLARIVPATLVQVRGLQTAGQEIAHVIVGEQQHPAIRVVDDKPLAGAEEFVRDNQRPDGVIAGSTASITNHMGIAFGETGVFCWIESGIHTGEDREMAARGERQVVFVSEALCVF